MAVTAKLSKAFYDKFGDEATNELVNWLNAVNDTCRADLRELNELNFARFDAKLEQRIAELGAALRVEMTHAGDNLKTGLLRWMFGFWATTVLAIVALYFRE